MNQEERAALREKYKLTDSQFEEYRSAFEMFDTDGSGDISAEELQSVLSQLGKPVSLEEAKKSIELIDANGDGQIDFGEFIVMMEAGTQEDELRAAFEIFDLDGNGYIDRDELKNVLAKLSGKTPTDAEVDAMMGEADADGDGKITFEEFKIMMKDD